MDREEFYKNYKPFGNQMILDIIKDFKDDIPDKLNSLSTAIEQKSFDNIRTISHNIKGSLGVFYDEKARQLASELEMSGKKQRKDVLEEQFQKLSELVNELLRELDQVKQELENE
ncbi:MAG: Hpt domain-containing protein [Bacteroidales bacterium]|nr:Hpt domain-containing protein [Bacteroidales bacterium]